MSALDIAGAVVWTPFALTFLIWSARCRGKPGYVGGMFWCLVAGAASALAGTYCIARLCGAHA